MKLCHLSAALKTSQANSCRGCVPLGFSPFIFSSHHPNNSKKDQKLHRKSLLSFILFKACSAVFKPQIVALVCHSPHEAKLMDRNVPHWNSGGLLRQWYKQQGLETLTLSLQRATWSPLGPISWCSKRAVTAHACKNTCKKGHTRCSASSLNILLLTTISHGGERQGDYQCNFSNICEAAHHRKTRHSLHPQAGIQKYLYVLLQMLGIMLEVWGVQSRNWIRTWLRLYSHGEYKLW